MEIAMHIIFALGFSLLLIHEMDAIRCKEWNMFTGLKTMKEESAFRFFLVLHLPLYVLAITLLISRIQIVGFYLVDVFLVLHVVLHLLFKRNTANNFRNLSHAIIYLSGVCGAIHLVYLLIS
ncbi:DUF6713 family protein [Raoultibacter massiliensis]|uniref:DUF6713 family protein n=1 Tax=Raoultibacter massiliensis TaxID=1852371 RepID=UPI003A953CE4